MHIKGLVNSMIQKSNKGDLDSDTAASDAELEAKRVDSLNNCKGEESESGLKALI